MSPEYVNAACRCRPNWTCPFCARWLTPQPQKPTGTSDTEVRFWSRLERTDNGCWNWTGTVARTGYGFFSIGRNSYLVHRLAYEFAVGPIPAGMMVDHTCRNRRCVNPAHLRAVSNKQNQENAGLRRDNKSGVRGVSWNPRKQKWSAGVCHHGRRVHIGSYTSLADAEAAVIAKRNELFTHNDADRNPPQAHPPKDQRDGRTGTRNVAS